MSRTETQQDASAQKELSRSEKKLSLIAAADLLETGVPSRGMADLLRRIAEDYQ